MGTCWIIETKENKHVPRVENSRKRFKREKKSLEMDNYQSAFHAVLQDTLDKKAASDFFVLDSGPSLALAFPPFHELNLSRHCVQLIELQRVVRHFLPKGPTKNTSS